MLFDEKDLRVFDNDVSKNYFREILQSYYSQNYRAAIVLLYSFVIYDLYIKLQTMSNEGDAKAKNKLEEINSKIENDNKYSEIENEIIDFFIDNCPLYFNRFKEDVTYLKQCRHKCAHLKVDDTTLLFNPKDYQVRMLICSMYDNILSIRAPFINDLFQIVQPDIERYASNSYILAVEGVNEKFVNEISSKYLERMTKDSIKVSYRTFIKLLLVVNDDKCIDNLYGVYVFVYSITDYIINKGYANEILNDSIVESHFDKVNVDECRQNEKRIEIIEHFALHFSIIMDKISKNSTLFEFLSHYTLDKPNMIKYYKMFYPRESKSVFQYFKENDKLHTPYYALQIYEGMSANGSIDIYEYAMMMISYVPSYNGFDDADGFMEFFIKYLYEFDESQINEILSIYNSNNQCKYRGRHCSDMEIINRHLENMHTDNLSFLN